MNNHRNYITRNIRELLQAAFSDSDLGALCLDFFPELYDQFTVGMNRNDKINHLLDYCRRYLAFGELLQLVSKMNPTQYPCFEPYWEPTHLDEEGPLAEWRKIHQNSLDILHALHVPLRQLIIYEHQPEPPDLILAADWWRLNCISKLKSVRQWDLSHVKHDALDNLREKTSGLDRITEQLNKLKTGKAEQPEIQDMRKQLEDLQFSLWDVLDVTDETITSLVESSDQ
jgi:hypothetical protein